MATMTQAIDWQPNRVASTTPPCQQPWNRQRALSTNEHGINSVDGEPIRHLQHRALHNSAHQYPIDIQPLEESHVSAVLYQVDDLTLMSYLESGLPYRYQWFLS